MIGKLVRLRFGGFTLVELMVVVAILGILAVIAVPAFLRYMRRAKTTEAIDELDKIYKGAAFYYTSTHIDKSGSRIYCQFPTSQGLTPGTGDCCNTASDANKDGRCDSNSLQWNSVAWSALTFQINDEVYFRYSWASNGSALDKAAATANAHADLDCDTTYSTFQRLVWGDKSASFTECASVGSSAFFVDNETE